MTDPSFLLQNQSAKDLMELARSLQALVDGRATALEQPLTGFDFDISAYDTEPALSVDH